MLASMKPWLGQGGVPGNGCRTSPELLQTARIMTGCISPMTFLDYFTFENFYKIDRPAFKESASRACMDAVFKRGAFIVRTKSRVHYQPAGINTDYVFRISVLPAGYLSAVGRCAYGE